MIIVIQGSFGHRLLNGGMVESTKVVNKENGQVKVLNEWKERNPEDMGLSPAEFQILRASMNELNLYVPRTTVIPEKVVKEPEMKHGSQLEPMS